MSIELVENRLVSLLDKAREDRQKISVVVSREYDSILEARSLAIPWTAIAEALGFPGRVHGVEKAFLRRKRKGSLSPGRHQTEKLKTKNEKEFAVRESPNQGSPVTRTGVRLLDGKVSKNGACEIFNSFKSID